MPFEEAYSSASIFFNFYCPGSLALVIPAVIYNINYVKMLFISIKSNHYLDVKVLTHNTRSNDKLI